MTGKTTAKVTGRASIFDTIAQEMVVDPSRIEPMVDRVLIEDLGEMREKGLIIKPDTAKQSTLRIGRVVAVGRGDKWTEHGLDATGAVRRRAVAPQPGHAWEVVASGKHKRCSTCYMAYQFGHDLPCPGAHDGRLRMSVKAGDRVLYQQRRDLEVTIGGSVYTLCNEQQSVWAVLED